MLCCAGLQEGEIGVARGVDVGVLRHVRRLGLVLEGRGGGGARLLFIRRVWIAWLGRWIIGLVGNAAYRSAFLFLLRDECVIWGWFYIEATWGWGSDSGIQKYWFVLLLEGISTR